MPPASPGTRSEGVASGLKAGLRYRREGLVPALSPELPGRRSVPLTMDPLPRPPRRRSRQSLRLALLCGEFGGPVYGGVGVYTAHLADALASRGHDVTVFRSRIGPCRIEPAGYRIVDVPFDGDPVRERHNFLMALHREADRREFDLVESPLWAGNGAAVGSAARWPLVVRLETPFALIREMSGIEYNHAVKTLIAAEQLQLVYATGIIGISEAVVSTVESTYHIPADLSRPTARGHSPGIALGGPHPVSTGRDAGCRRDEVPLHRPVRGAQGRTRAGRGIREGRPSGCQGDALARRCR